MIPSDSGSWAPLRKTYQTSRPGEKQTRPNGPAARGRNRNKPRTADPGGDPFRDQAITRKSLEVR